jgi:Ca-activated chloride channel family protein
MFTLASPWFLLLLPAPLFVCWLGKPHTEHRVVLQVPFIARLARLTGERVGSRATVARRTRLQAMVSVAAWIAIVMGCARPQWIEPPVTRTVPTRDLLIAVDLSGSMETEDFLTADGMRVDRVTAVKQVLDAFLERRTGDRVGIIVFGSAPFVLVPFTDDLDACRSLLDEMQSRMAGPQTMLGDAIGKAISVFEQSELEDQVLVLLTDGNDTGSLVTPLKAAEIARDRDITVQVIAMGDPASVGEEKLDTETLGAVAEATGGRLWLALDRAALETAYAELDAMETREADTLSFRPVRELYMWPLAFAVCSMLAFHGVLALRELWTRDTVSA